MGAAAGDLWREYHEIVEKAHLCAVILDAQGRVAFCNDFFLARTGYAREEVAGRSFFDAFLPPVLRDPARVEFRSAFASGRSESRGESPVLARDGTVRLVVWSDTVLHDAAARATGIIRIGEDVTDRRLAEMALRDSEERLRQVAEGVDEVFWLFDIHSNRFVYLSPALEKVWGISRETAFRRPSAVVRAVPREDRRTLIRALHKAEITQVVEYRVVRPDGTVGRVQTRAVPVRARNGGVVRMAGVSRDVTDERALEDALRRHEALSALGELLAHVAHEVRNPLFAISGTLDALSARLGDRADLAPFWEVLRSEMARLTSVMNEVLDYGRPAVWEPVPVPPEAITREALAQCASAAARARVVLRDGSAQDLPAVLSDRRQMVQALRNVVENAVLHAPPGTEVNVAARTMNGDVRAVVEWCVQDSGPGFPPQELDRVFLPFVSRRRGGTGIGLSIVQRVVSRHGGTVFARNRDGGGAEVVLRVPCT